MKSIVSALALLVAAVTLFAPIVTAQPTGLPAIVRRTYIGYFTPIDQDIGVEGTLRSTDGTCIFTLIPSTYENTQAGIGPQGGQLMQGSGSCRGMFELDIFPYTGLGSTSHSDGGGASPGLQPGSPSDFGNIGRFGIESVTPSNINPHGYPPHYSTITTGTAFILHSPSNNLGGTTEGPYAVMLDGITTRAPIN